MSQPPGSPLPPPFPPVYFPPVYSQPRGGGFARGVFNALAVTILGMSITLNVYLLIANGVFHTEHVQKTVITDGDAKNAIAVIPIEGVIVEATVQRFDTMLKAALADESVKAIVLQINSPGGSVTASDEIYQKLQILKKDKGIPIIASIGELGTSGGYYIACGTDQIVAQRTSWTGNIGVLLPRYSLAELVQKYGIKETTLHSTGSDFKDAGSMFKDDTSAQTAYWQGLVDEAFGIFKQVIRDGRKLDATTVDQLANGKVYSGPEAVQLKLADQVGYLDDAVKIAADKAGLGSIKPNVIRFEESKSLLESFGASSVLRSNGVSAQVGAMNVNIDRDVLDAFMVPRPMYLWQGR